MIGFLCCSVAAKAFNESGDFPNPIILLSDKEAFTQSEHNADYQPILNQSGGPLSMRNEVLGGRTS